MIFIMILIVSMFLELKFLHTFYKYMKIVQLMSQII